VKNTDIVKYIVSGLTGIGGIGGSYYKMEQRVSVLEQQIEKQAKIRSIELEIAQMKRDEELQELEHRMKMDSIRFAHKKYQVEK